MVISFAPLSKMVSWSPFWNASCLVLVLNLISSAHAAPNSGLDMSAEQALFKQHAPVIEQIRGAMLSSIRTRYVLHQITAVPILTRFLSLVGNKAPLPTRNLKQITPSTQSSARIPSQTTRAISPIPRYDLHFLPSCAKLLMED